MELAQAKLCKFYEERGQREESNIFNEPISGSSLCKMFVELALTQSDDVDKEWKEHGDYSYHLNQMQNTAKFLSIALEDLITKKDLIVLLRGIAGQGKSTLVNQIVIEWATRHMWKSIPSFPTKMYKWMQKKLKSAPSRPKYSLILLFSSRELNVLESDLSILSLYDLAQKQCNNALRDLTETEFNATLEKSLIIIDGVDELSCLSSITKKPKHHHQQTFTVFEGILRSVLTRKYGHSLLITGRPGACHSVQLFCKELFKVKRVEVLGFSREKVREYVCKFFSASNDTKSSDAADKLIDAIEKIPNLAAMSRIPVLLWIICCVYQDARDIEAPNTMTELFVLACLVFLKKHMLRNIDDYENDPCKVNAEICTVLRLVGKLSYEMRTVGKVVFPASELDIDTKLLVKCGLLVPLYINGVLHYVFRHLTFQEFLCAFHIFFENIPFETIKDNENLNGVFPLLSGLQGACLESTKSPAIVRDFVASLVGYGFSNVPRERHIVNLLCKQLAPYERTVNFGKDSRFSMLFLAIFFEYQNPIADDLFKKIEAVTFNFGGYSRHEFSQTVYFLEHAVAKNIIIKHLNFQLCNLSTSTCIQMIPFLPKCKWIGIGEEISLEFVKQLSHQVHLCSREELQLDNLLFNVSLLSDAHLAELSTFIPKIRKVSFMGNNEFTHKGFEQLGKFISSSVGEETLVLQCLDLRCCKLNDQGIKGLSKCIPYLQVLTLNGNVSITARGFKYMASSIVDCAENKSHHFNLHTLKLSNCGMGNSGFMAFCKAIPLIKKINLLNNDFEPSCMESLVINIEEHTRSNTLKLEKIVLVDATKNRLRGLLRGKDHNIQLLGR